MSAPTDTATVETLTAEVHVLKVGNRQITQSVAKQLDVIPFDRIKPFGRIQVGGPPARWRDAVDVIGADIDTGALCRSHVMRARSVADDQRDQHDLARALPLIVLAGLR